MNFENPNEAQLAKNEGWTLRGGLPTRYFNGQGYCPFHSLSALFEFLAAKGQTSELHKRIYLGLPWLDCDRIIAVSRGFEITWLGEFHILSRTRTRKEIETELKLDAENGDLFAIKAVHTLTTRRLGIR